MTTTLVGVTTGLDVLPSQALLNNTSLVTVTPGGWQVLPMEQISQATADITLVGGGARFNTDGFYLIELSLNIVVTGSPVVGDIGVGIGDSGANPFNDADMSYPAYLAYQLGQHLLWRVHAGDELYFLYNYNCGGVPTIPANGGYMTAVRIGAAVF